MDISSIIGLILSFLAIAMGHGLEGGHLSGLIQPAALLIVVGGTAGAVLLQNGWSRVRASLGMLLMAFKPEATFYDTLTKSIQTWNSTARLEGFLQLEKFIDTQADAYVAKGLRMIVDGLDAEKIRTILQIDTQSHVRTQKSFIKVWESAGGYAPTIGLLGAVLGLIRVMENISDPGALGSGIAMAFVATLYGVGLANLVCLPIANKLKHQLTHNVLKREMLAEAFVSIAHGESTLMLQERMRSYWQKGL